MNKVAVTLLLISLSFTGKLHAFSDTVRVMTYNVLYYGETPACQAPHDTLHGYLKTIVGYANPDLLGLVKVSSWPLAPGDRYGSAPAGFPDSILRFALEPAYPGRYAYCPVTNLSHGNDMQVLFYNTNKLGYLSVVANYANINDFTTWKFYYRSAGLTAGSDTVFLYITLNHTESGADAGSTSMRASQISRVMGKLDTLFTTQPNYINMGDFNFHKSTEAGYQRLVSSAYGIHSLVDPPFGIDSRYSYPADWDSNPSSYAASLTTSTRLVNSPNACGTTGGAKSWYDHIFLSAPLVHGTDGIKYIPGSYITLGNDGRRTGRSINDTPANISVPSGVLNALFRMSNKYPVMVSLLVDPRFTGLETKEHNRHLSVENPISNNLRILLGEQLQNKPIAIGVYDLMGREVVSLTAQGIIIESPAPWLPGSYILKINALTEGIVYQQLIVKQ